MTQPSPICSSHNAVMEEKRWIRRIVGSMGGGRVVISIGVPKADLRIFSLLRALADFGVKKINVPGLFSS